MTATISKWSIRCLVCATVMLASSAPRASAAVLGGVDLGNLTDHLFVFTNGSSDLNWQGATNGFIGDVAVNGLVAKERSSGSVPYAGTIYTNDSTLGNWARILTNPSTNSTQAFASTGQTAKISGLVSDLTSAFSQINALPASSGYSGVAATSLNGLNTQNGINEVFVINVTSGFSNITSKINITGDPGDVFIMRWDTSIGTAGYQGEVKFSSGGGIVPLGGLTPGNFVHVAGDINASGGGSNPPAPYPQGPRYDDGLGALITGGANFSGGGFFTGYWLTTGDPVKFETESLSNAIFVGGWYSSSVKISMTSGTSGVYVTPIPEPAGLGVLLLAAVGLIRRRRPA
jgi:MYXO-CTERM domain-containing protein